MPRRNEYTFVIERPVGSALAERMTKFLAENALKQHGLTAEITVRGLRPGEESYLIQPQKNTQAVG